MILTILIAFVSLVGLMVIHEFGHFILAKKFGTKVEEFGIGYPPRLFGKKIGETVYSLNLIPFGAFVRVHGEQGGIEDYHSFSGKPMWQRLAIVLGGVVSFWVVSVVILSIVAGVWGLPAAVQDEDNQNLADPRVQIIGIAGSSPAEKAGLKIGDTVVGFGKVKDFQDFISANKGNEVSLEIKRASETLAVQIVPRIITPADEGPLGVALTRIALRQYSWYQAVPQGVVSTAKLTSNVVDGWTLAVKNIFGKAELPDGVKLELMGPLGIFDLLGEYFQIGVNYFLFLIALISVALALANLLPIPALDGGKVIFLLVEAIRGKAINHKLEQRVTSVFFAMLIILMIFVTIKFDIPRVF